MTQRRRIRLGLSMRGYGYHAAAWRHPDAPRGATLDINYYVGNARIAERGKFDMVFLADGIGIRGKDEPEGALCRSSQNVELEPLTLLSAVSVLTKHIGVVATASTTYNEPYHIARKFASLDHISRGRVGWNVVTSWSEQEAYNFGLDAHVEHGRRYRRAEEFVDVVFGLWDSWEDDAFIRDQASGRYFDPAKMHTLNHRGEVLRVKGPLNTARPLQGYPVIAQAGSSGPGQDLGARIADLIYTAQKTKEDAVAFYSSVKSHGVARGRDPGSMLVMPGILPVLGRTRQQAQDRFDQLQDMVHPRVGLPMLAEAFGDLSGLPLDGPLPPPLATSNAVKSGHDKLAALARQPGMTIAGLYKIMAGAQGHHVFVGTPSEAADLMQDWFENGACDGWNLIPPYLPDPAIECLEWLVPELQRRGLFQTEYQGDGTFRGSMGLARPPFRSRGATSTFGRSTAAALPVNGTVPEGPRT